MQTKMIKSVLIDLIKENMVKHEEIYEKAWIGYQDLVLQTLTKNLKSIKEGKRVSVYVHEQVPVNHTVDYQRAIEMLNHSVDDYVSLNTEDYSRYVQDNWEWKQQWAATNSKYTVS